MTDMPIEAWRKLAGSTIPQLEAYCAMFGMMINAAAMQQLLDDHNDIALFIAFKTIWDDLPDIPAIHIAPFDAISALVAEFPNDQTAA